MEEPGTSLSGNDQHGVATHLLLNRVMTEINRKLSVGADYKRLLDFIFDSLNLVIPYERIGIATVEGTGDESRLALNWVKSKIPVAHLNASYSALIKGSSLAEVIDTGHPRVINDLQKYLNEHPTSESTRLAMLDGIRSSLTCPLRFEDKPIGVVFFSSVNPGTYHAAHTELFSEIADELSMVLNFGKLKNEFDVCSLQRRNLNMILHDLRSPLSTIIGFTQLSQDEPWFQGLDPDAKAVFDVILRNGRYMLELLNALLEVGRLDQNPELVVLEDVPLIPFAEEMTELARSMGSAKSVSVVAKTNPSLPSAARFDRTKIRRVLDNLFSNAIKYSQRGGKIEFSLSMTPARLYFAVADSSLGIPETELSKLFLDFSRTSVRPTEGELSTGLGLSIAKRIVEQHQGEISVKSRVGQGSVFSFWIPLNRALAFH